MNAYSLIIAFASLLCIGFGMMTGGWTVKDPNSEEVQKHGKYAAAKISASMNSLHHMKLTNISEVKSQVVAGMNYKMKITLSPTVCKKNQANSTQLNIDECELLPCGAPTICNVTIWVQAWKENGTKVTKSSCDQGEPSC